MRLFYRVNSSESISVQLVNWPVLTLRRVSILYPNNNKLTLIMGGIGFDLVMWIKTLCYYFKTLKICSRSPEWHSSFPMREAITSSIRWWPTTNLRLLVRLVVRNTCCSKLYCCIGLPLTYHSGFWSRKITIRIIKVTIFYFLQKCASSPPTPTTSPCAVRVISLWPALMTKRSWMLLMWVNVYNYLR